MREYIPPLTGRLVQQLSSLLAPQSVRPEPLVAQLGARLFPPAVALPALPALPADALLVPALPPPAPATGLVPEPALPAGFPPSAKVFEAPALLLPPLLVV